MGYHATYLHALVELGRVRYGQWSGGDAHGAKSLVRNRAGRSPRYIGPFPEGIYRVTSQDGKNLLLT